MRGRTMLLLLLGTLTAGLRMTEADETEDPVRIQHLAGGVSPEPNGSQEENLRTAPRFTRLKSQDYPSVVYIVPIPKSSADALQADRVFLEYMQPTEKPMERMQQIRKDGVFVGPSGLEPVSSKERVWYKAGPHPLLSKILPGADFYVVALDGDIGSPILEYRFLAAVDDGKFYMLPDQLARLLYDNGLQFRESDIETWVHALVLVWSALKQPYLQHQTAWSRQLRAVGIRSDSAEKLELFPGVSIVHADIPVKGYITGECGMIEVLRNGERSTLQVELANIELPSGETLAVRCVPSSLVEVDDEGLHIDGTFELDYIETSGE